ncbi:MAG TPA: cyclophilin-like family protein [Burkholderiales bacterium]|nr:cyclophilin-like family protein [Burkholderiales bacterium]
MTRLRLESGGISIELELEDCATTAALAAAAPFEARAQTWGEELYFSTPVSAKLEAGAKQVVEPGTVCFWTEGDALALPWGRTPISTGDKPKLANPCSVLGRVAGDFLALKKIKSGSKIRVSAA